MKQDKIHRGKRLWRSLRRFCSEMLTVRFHCSEGVKSHVDTVPLEMRRGCVSDLVTKRKLEDDIALTVAYVNALEVMCESLSSMGFTDEELRRLVE
ncbi:hypothetical protein D4Q85_00630 [bacterium]|nr:MAG: hypothetical protein D4Q85_00630 [bacterium]